MEADIVARQGETLVFVEVKTRASEDFGSPDRAIGAEKQKNIIRAARAYVTRAGIDWSHVRFDTISVVMTDPPSLTHEKDAFSPGPLTLAQSAVNSKYLPCDELRCCEEVSNRVRNFPGAAGTLHRRGFDHALSLCVVIRRTRSHPALRSSR